jgi:very-short-patch-repair endonuclease
MRGLRISEIKRARQLRHDSTSAERKLWSRLKNRGVAGAKFVRQEPVGPYFADFCCRELRLIIELDGATHSSEAEVAHDAARTAILEVQGYRVMRFNNVEVYENCDGVVETIWHVLMGDVQPS